MTSFTCSFICITCKVSVENSYFKRAGWLWTFLDRINPLKQPWIEIRQIFYQMLESLSLSEQLIYRLLYLWPSIWSVCNAICTVLGCVKKLWIGLPLYILSEPSLVYRYSKWKPRYQKTTYENHWTVQW